VLISALSFPPGHTALLLGFHCRGDESVLDGFCAFFEGRQLEKGTEVTLLWQKGGLWQKGVCSM